MDITLIDIHLLIGRIRVWLICGIYANDKTVLNYENGLNFMKTLNNKKIYYYFCANVRIASCKSAQASFLAAGVRNR